ncbi:ion transporter [Apibacter adventoris]|uniref:Ion transporter n=1 Tax=Apibacter adventoris TaxID=1679466 RepID=A0A2S8AGZ6_9FLAO|nr:ion transporter [Apibacter adventoris]PQL92539.1 ion transporter [Apibacter adventoris]PQL95546.1 ion transporter [Apibacter adventoris]
MKNIFRKIKYFFVGYTYEQKEGTKKWQFELHEIIFESDTFKGKIFDITLLFFISLSTLIIMLESVQGINHRIGFWLYILDWWVTISFTIEYVLRLCSVKKTTKYVTSFYGIIDLISIIPTYLSVIFLQSHYLAIIRILRLLRIFKILKLGSYINESNALLISLKKSKRKIFVFLYFIIITTLILGALMYVIENKYNSENFSSIPQSMYWAIVTLTTVGYGDVAPITIVGKIIASGIMILGYSIISVPAGLVSAEYTRNKKIHLNTQKCRFCMAENHEPNAKYCFKCGHLLNEEFEESKKS